MSIEFTFIAVIYFFIFLISLLFGSFLNVLLYRTKENISIAKSRSFCPNCKKQIYWYDNIPLLSYILLHGKCRNCKQHISLQYPIVELITGLVGFICGIIVFGNVYENFLNFKYILTFIYIFFIFFALLYFAIYDILYFEINDKVAIPFILLLTIINIVAIFKPLTITTSLFEMPLGLSNIIAAGIGFVLILLIIFLSKGKMGGGDLRFIIIVGLIVGLANLYLTFMASVVIGSVIGIIVGIIKRQFKGLALPFIPLLCLGIIVGLVWGSAFNSYLFGV